MTIWNTFIVNSRILNYCSDFLNMEAFIFFSFTAILVILFRPLQLIIHPYVCINLSRCFRNMLEFNSVTQSLTEENFLQHIPYTAISLLTSDGNVLIPMLLLLCLIS